MRVHHLKDIAVKFGFTQGKPFRVHPIKLLHHAVKKYG